MDEVLAMAMKLRKRAKERKREEVERLKSMLSAYKTVAIVNFRGLRAKQFQEIRRDFRGKCIIRVSKNSLIRFSLKDSGVEDMIPYVNDQTALVFSNLDPFELFKLIESSKKPAPIRAGAVAPKDIVVEAGETSLRPGPVVGELQRVGIPAGIERGKVVVKKRTVVVKAGERVSPEVADVLAKLEIYPVEEGLTLQAIYDREAGILFLPDVLRIKPEDVLKQVEECAKHAFNLAFNIKYAYPTPLTVGSLLAEASYYANSLALSINYPTKTTIRALLQKALAQAFNLSLNACIYTSENIAFFIAKAEAEAKALAEHLNM